jgi:hypothetical protein
LRPPSLKIGQRARGDENLARAATQRGRSAAGEAEDSSASATPLAANQRWSLDFVGDQLTRARRFRILAQAYEMSERRACRVIGTDRTSVRYQGVRPADGSLRERLKPWPRSDVGSAIAVCTCCCGAKAMPSTDPAGPGVSALGDTTQNVTIVATQADGSAASLKGRR